MQPICDVVAIFNASEDTTSLLRNVLQSTGFEIVSARTSELRNGRLDLTKYMRQHKPCVVVWDIGMPYEENWRLFEQLKANPAFQGVRFVLTTNNAAHVVKIAGAQQLVHEIVGKPFNVNEVVTAVKEAARQRPTS